MTDRTELLKAQVAAQPYPLVFATISGAHLYGFASEDSDYDLRGAHVLPAAEVLGLGTPKETVDSTRVVEGVEIDVVTHDARKFFLMLLKRNGYVLEQLLSPLVVHTSPAHMELVGLAPKCITKHHVHHYAGFFHTEWRLFSKAARPRVKPLLYCYRVLLTGIHLMRTGEVIAHLPTLAGEYRLSYLDELIALKREGREKEEAAGVDVAWHEVETHRLLAVLYEESERTSLPDMPSAKERLSDLLVTLRLG